MPSLLALIGVAAFIVVIAVVFFASRSRSIETVSLTGGAANLNASALKRSEAKVLALAQQGQLIEAIKMHRLLTGQGLKESRDAVEALLRGDPVPLAPAPAAPATAAVLEALRAGNKIEAIKTYRELHGVGLKEAKDAVEALERQGDAAD